MEVILGHSSVPMHGYNHLFGRKMAQVQSQTHTLDPRPKCFEAKLFHILFLIWENVEVRFWKKFWQGMMSLIQSVSITSSTKASESFSVLMMCTCKHAHTARTLFMCNLKRLKANALHVSLSRYY
jgi:hypothetical protein